MLEQLVKQIKGLNNEDYNRLAYFVAVEEKQRRDALPEVEKAEAELVRDLQDAGQLPRPNAGTEATADNAPAWQNPGTDRPRMYHVGQTVTHNGRTWVSRHLGLNHWEPGAHGVDSRIWEDITPAPELEPGADGASGIPAWQPGKNYQIGTLVTHNGQTYRVAQAHTSAEHWQPQATPSLYQIHH